MKRVYCRLAKAVMACLILALLFGFTPMVKADTYIVAVGINRYKAATSLHLSETDAKDFVRVAKKMPGAHVAIITGRYATHSNILKILKKQYAGTKADDTLIFYFSGHGSAGGLCTYDSKSSNIEDLLQFATIAAIMKQSPAKKKIIIADSCFSGTSRGGASSSQSRTNTDPSVLLFMSSRANESSLETTGAKNSLFTSHLLTALGGAADVNSDRLITARELFDYVSRGVRRDSRNYQHPVMWGNFDTDFVIFRL